MTTTNLDAALSYAARGWSVLPLYPILDSACGCGDLNCPAPGKHPVRHLVPNGLHNATTDPATIHHWFTNTPNAHIGIRTGVASGMIAIDLDDRPQHGRDGRATWLRLIADHANGTPPDTIEASTGGGGRHLFFQTDQPIASSKDQLGPGVEVKAEGGYVVAAPSGHISGGEYVWDGAAHPDDQPVAPIPDWLAPLLTVRAPKTAGTITRLPVTLAPLEVAELRSALSSLSSDDRDDWIQVGMALHHTGDDANGFALWDEWSQTSSKYSEKDAKRVWRSFTDRSDGVTTASIYARALTAGWQRPDVVALATIAGVTLPTIAEPVITTTTRNAQQTPSNPFLEPLPGILEDIAHWGEACAPRPVRLYAVSAALSLGSVLCARRYVTAQGNYSSLYFLTIGKSGTGKEHVRTVVEEVLMAVAPELIGPNAWTSGSAVFSGLLNNPHQIAVIDEIGKWLEATSGNGESARMKDTVNTELMQLFGRLHGRARMTQYSTATLSPKQQESFLKKVVERPALTVNGLTTPDTWYGALRSARIASGFMNRFLVINGEHTPRGDHQMPSPQPVPDTVTTWARQILTPRGDMDLLNRTTEIPPAYRLSVTTQAQAAYLAFGRDCNRWADQLDSDGLGELPMRAGEMAMRLGLIAALAEEPTAHRVSESHATWAISCLQYALAEFVGHVHARMADTPLHALRKAFVAAIKASGSKGLTQREIVRCSALQGVSRRERDDAVTWAQESGEAVFGFVSASAKGGRPRHALVSTEYVEVMTETEGS